MSLTTNHKLKNTTQIASGDKNDVYMDENNDSYEKTIDIKNGLPYFDMKKLKSIRVLISGSSGSGKTYLCEKILEQIDPVIVYLFSSINDDDYKKFNVKRIDLNKIIEKTPMSINDIYELIENDAIVIFDDVISFGSKQAKPYLELRLLCLTKGRHKNISTIIVEQQAQAGNSKGAREILLNCSYFVMFPRNNFRSFKAITTQYLGLEKQTIEYLKSINSRYILLSKNHPAYYVSGVECGMI